MGRTMFGGMNGVVPVGYQAGLPIGPSATVGGVAGRPILSERCGDPERAKVEKFRRGMARRLGHIRSVAWGWSVSAHHAIAGRVR